MSLAKWIRKFIKRRGMLPGCLVLIFGAIALFHVFIHFFNHAFVVALYVLIMTVFFSFFSSLLFTEINKLDSCGNRGYFIHTK